jgi:hypothetical protein
MRKSASPAKPFSAWWLIGWALAVVILIAGSGQAGLHQDFSDPDNAMRLVRVRDLLNGQAWFDPVQHRLNPPDGTPMHWARWIDAAIAAPIAVLRPLLGQHNAEIAVAFLWPLGLLAAFMALVVRVCGEIGVRDGLRRETEIAGAIVAALAFPVIEKFGPGQFDHHNIELIFGLSAVLGLMRMRDEPWAGGVAGLALGAAMATAAESVPLVAVGMMIAGLLWLVKREEHARGLAWLGAGLAVSSVVSFFLLVSPSNWGMPVCDAMSTPFLGLGLIGGAVAAVLGKLPALLNATLWRRLAAASVLGCSAIVSLFVLFPECAHGGYSGLSAEMERLWMSQISETRPLLGLMNDDPALMLAMGGAAFAGLVAATVYLRRHWREADGWILLAFLLSSWAILLWQIRGATFATAFAIPFGAWAVAKARRSYRAKASAIRALAFAGIAASSAAAAWASAGGALQSRLVPKTALAIYEARVSDFKACFKPEAYVSLNVIAPGVMLNHFSLGADVLAFTKHSVLAGPYHRDAAGTMAMINALRSGSDAARAIISATSADYVLICPELPETVFYARHAADGVIPDATLSARLARGDEPEWLEPVDLAETPLKLYRIKR